MWRASKTRGPFGKSGGQWPLGVSWVSSPAIYCDIFSSQCQIINMIKRGCFCHITLYSRTNGWLGSPIATLLISRLWHTNKGENRIVEQTITHNSIFAGAAIARILHPSTNRQQVPLSHVTHQPDWPRSMPRSIANSVKGKYIMREWLRKTLSIY